MSWDSPLVLLRGTYHTSNAPHLSYCAIVTSSLVVLQIWAQHFNPAEHKPSSWIKTHLYQLWHWSDRFCAHRCIINISLTNIKVFCMISTFAFTMGKKQPEDFGVKKKMFTDEGVITCEDGVHRDLKAGRNLPFHHFPRGSRTQGQTVTARWKQPT